MDIFHYQQITYFIPFLITDLAKLKKEEKNRKITIVH